MPENAAVQRILYAIIDSLFDPPTPLETAAAPFQTAEPRFFYCRTCRAIMPLSDAMDRSCANATGMPLDCPLPPDIF